MCKGKEILGLTVVDLNDGKNVGRVKDLLYDSCLRKILALVLDHEGWFHGEGILPIETLAGVGEDAILVGKGSDGLPAGKDHALDGCSSLLKTKGKQVLTTGGKELGSVEDFLLDIGEGKITGIEISGGIIDDVVRGRVVVSIEDVQIIGKDAVIIGNRVEKLWH